MRALTCRLAGMALGLAAAGCAIGPDYARPDVENPGAYLQGADEGPSIANLPWWEVFEDPQLQALVTAALQDNKDLAIAAARIEEARAQLGFVRADQFPTINAGGSGSRGEDNSIVQGAGITERWVLAGTLSYEIDVWGRLRRQTEAARAELLATEEARRTVVITLVSDVASTYLLLRDLDARREIAERTVTSREQSLGIIQSRFDQGTVPLIDVNQAEIELADAAAQRAAIERELIQAENLLSVLLGRNPGPILRGRELRDQRSLPVVPAGLPSELLERRPDIRQAEQLLAAQTARIGAAQALRLPTLNLTGALGVASSDLSDLIDSDSELWSIGGDFFGPLFDSGRSKRRVEVEKARTEQLLLNYEQTILLALREVEDSLAAARTLRSELAARDRQVVAARSAATLSRARYDGGVTSYLEVLDSERSLFQAELAASATRRAQQVSIVQLYKALGGGWVPETPPEGAAGPAN
jgi:multidrug efflux system outer membrane protein